MERSFLVDITTMLFTGEPLNVPFASISRLLCKPNRSEPQGPSLTGSRDTGTASRPPDSPGYLACILMDTQTPNRKLGPPSTDVPRFRIACKSRRNQPDLWGPLEVQYHHNMKRMNTWQEEGETERRFDCMEKAGLSLNYSTLPHLVSSLHKPCLHDDLPHTP